MIYLDNAATTRPFDDVIACVSSAQDTLFANPSSMHHAGFAAEKAIRSATEEVRKLLGAPGGHIIYTSGGSESNNLAVFGTVFSKISRGGHVVVSAIEHPSVLEPIRAMEAQGARVTFVAPNADGVMDPTAIADAVCEDTVLVSVMAVNNETGAIAPVAQIAKTVKAKNPNTYLHTDCVQAAGNIPVSVKRMGADLLSFSGHKINGPKGVGLLYVSDRVRLNPCILGGHQQNNFRSGTENTPGILGFARALRITCDSFSEKQARFARFKEILWENFSQHPLFTVNNYGEAYSHHIVSVSVKNVRAEVLLHSLEAQDICISAGSACSTNKPSPSHVLQAQGMDNKTIESTVRISFGAFNTEEEIRAFSEIMVREAEKLSRFTRV